jgi:hypothetical protein
MAYSFINSYNSGVTGTTVTIAVTYSAGQTAIVLCTETANSGATFTLTDNGGSNTYTPRHNQNVAFDGFTTGIYDCLSTAAGAVTLSLTSNAGTPAPEMWLLVYSGLQSFDQIASSAASSGWSTSTNGVLSPNITPGSQPGMLLGWAIAGTGNVSAGTAFNSRSVSVGDFAANVAEDLRFTSTAVTNSAFSTTLATTGMAVFGATYLEPPSGPPPVAPYGPMPKQLYIMP